MSKYIIPVNSSVAIREIQVNDCEKSRFTFSYKNTGFWHEDWSFLYAYTSANKTVPQHPGATGGPMKPETHIGASLYIKDKHNREHKVVIEDFSTERMILNYIGLN